MAQSIIAAITPADIALFALLLVLVFLTLIGVWLYSIWKNRLRDSLSPYTKLPLRRGSEISYTTAVKILRFLYDMHQYDNRIFNLKKAAVCRETGRIFPEAITWYEVIRIDWRFLQRRYPGKYVSWGSLTPEQKEIVREVHESLDGFQTEFSSSQPKPQNIEAKYAFAKPGPLYVDVETKVLLGWKSVPDTDFEVMIVQKPINVMNISQT